MPGVKGDLDLAIVGEGSIGYLDDQLDILGSRKRTLLPHCGQAMGNLAAVNTAGANAGSLCAGFLFLELFGLWASIRLLAAGYSLVALVLVMRWATSRFLIIYILMF